MSPKNPCRYSYVPLLLAITVSSLFSACKKDETVKPQTTASVDSSLSNSPKFTSSFTASNAAAQTYVASGIINITGASNMVISGKSIAGGTKAAITLCNCHNVEILNCKLYNSTNVGIYLYNCYNIMVKGNYITNVSTGVYVDHAPNGGIMINCNQFLNMQGPFPRGQFVQFNNVSGANNKINNNQCENVLGKSYPEDAISLYQCYGTATDPIIIAGNQIRGGGPSASGGGIMLGDSGGDYLEASYNTLVNPGQYGMAVSGGKHNSIVHNSIYGVSKSFTNIGLYVETIGNSPVANCTISGNKVKFYNAAGAVNGAWLASGISTPTGWTTNNWNADIDATILPATLITAH